MKTTKQELSEMIADLDKKQLEIFAQMTVNQTMINSLKKQFDELTTPERIRVPENIKFEERGEYFAIVSPNGKCRLFAMDIHDGVPCVGEAGSLDDMTEDLITYPLYLEPCKREDLKCGDVAYAADVDINDMSFFADLEFYLVVLNDEESVRWNNINEMVFDQGYYDFWYKVVR